MISSWKPRRRLSRYLHVTPTRCVVIRIISHFICRCDVIPRPPKTPSPCYIQAHLACASPCTSALAYTSIHVELDHRWPWSF